MLESTLLTINQAAQLLGLHPQTVRKMCYSGRLARVHPTGTWSIRLRRADVLALTQPTPGAPDA